MQHIRRDKVIFAEKEEAKARARQMESYLVVRPVGAILTMHSFS